MGITAKPIGKLKSRLVKVDNALKKEAEALKKPKKKAKSESPEK